MCSFSVDLQVSLLECAVLLLIYRCLCWNVVYVFYVNLRCFHVTFCLGVVHLMTFSLDIQCSCDVSDNNMY